MSRNNAFRMVKRRAAAELPLTTCNHTFRATGITAYLANGGTIEKAQAIAAHESPQTTKQYDHALKKIGPKAVKAVPALIEGSGDPDGEIRRVPATSLAGIGPGASKAVPALVHLVSDIDTDVRWTACVALGAIGPKAAKAVPG